ncbi:G-protein coupled receptor family C group 5 member B isoform X2 [Gorilla gorilla gorilla]|uniref:G-protein coupled receptor family C group 5 member B isoform X2 n=1 Tax=Gorilla gorilla gorilla TaxID=9595 RepID=UPI00123E77F9|nr:G-protein coupled receptor family C group 5 member B isoform X2 [Gorilla gorilla gorilla]
MCAVGVVAILRRDPREGCTGWTCVFRGAKEAGVGPSVRKGTTTSGRWAVRREKSVSRRNLPGGGLAVCVRLAVYRGVGDFERHRAGSILSASWTWCWCVSGKLLLMNPPWSVAWGQEVLCAGTPGSRYLSRMFVASERKMRAHQVLTFLLLFVITSVASENASTSRGCGLDLLPQYVSLCDLDAIWGIVVEAVAGAGALITLLLMLILLVRLPFIKEKEKKSPVGLHFLFLLGTLGLFGLTFAFIIQEDETICSVRRFLWGVLFALCFSCLLSQAWRVRRLVRHGTGPAGWQLVGLALCLMLVQVIIAVEWLVLTVLRDTRPACAYEPMDFVMALIYDMVLLVVTLGLALFTLCGKFKRWKLNGAFLLITAFLSVLIWVAWMTMYLFGNVKLQQGDAWNDPTLAITLAASGWVFVIFHAIPEIHCTLLPALQENTPNYFDTSQPRMRETAFEEDVQLPRAYMENKAFSMDEHNAALRTAGFPNGSLGKRPSGSLGKRPSAPFRSNVYQPTEMAVVLNGGTIPTAPPSHTGRHLW